MRHAIVVNRVFGGGQHLAHYGDSAAAGGRGGQMNEELELLGRWAIEVDRLPLLGHRDRSGAFVVSFPENVSCLG